MAPVRFSPAPSEFKEMNLDVYRKVETAEAITGEFWRMPSRDAIPLSHRALRPFYSGHPCIEARTYQVVLTLSPHSGYVCPELLKVPGRTEIGWHIGNIPKGVFGSCVVGTAAGTMKSKTRDLHFTLSWQSLRKRIFSRNITLHIALRQRDDAPASI
jgi:hypothetical protein